jgi:hypothetical protein
MMRGEELASRIWVPGRMPVFLPGPWAGPAFANLWNPVTRNLAFNVADVRPEGRLSALRMGLCNGLGGPRKNSGMTFFGRRKNHLRRPPYAIHFTKKAI